MWGGDLHLQIIEIIFLKVSAKCSFFVLFFLIMPLNWKGGGGIFFIYSELDFFFLTIYTYKLLQAFLLLTIFT